VLTVRVDPAVPFAIGVTDAGEREQVTVAFTGEIPQVNATAELNPLNDVTVIVALVEFPIVVVAVAGTEERLKSFKVTV
jgi:hypothetical protein